MFMHATLLKHVFIKISMHKFQNSGATLCQLRVRWMLRRILHPLIFITITFDFAIPLLLLG